MEDNPTGVKSISLNQSLAWVTLFAIAFAFVESSVVVYLRGLYYPGGFSFPLKPIDSHRLGIELVRELCTIVVLAAVGMLAGRTRWQRFGFFMIAFALWDLFYYVWLKLSINWPKTLLDWDILFLIPLPWIGPVIAPVLISIFMIIAGVLIIRREEREGSFRPSKVVWTSAIVGTVIILYSFMLDTNATLHLQMPNPYRWEMLGVGSAAYVLSCVLAFRRK